MRIDLTTGTAVSSSEIERNKLEQTPSSHSAATNAPRAGNSEFSESNASIGKLAGAALNSPEVRADKVQALQSKLQSGTYKVSSAQVADSIIQQIRVRGS